MPKRSAASSDDSIRIRRELHRKQQATYYYKLKSTKDGHEQFNEMHRQRIARNRAKSANKKLLKVKEELSLQLSWSQRSIIDANVEHHRTKLESNPNFHLIDKDYKEDIKVIRWENKMIKYEVTVTKNVLGGSSMPARLLLSKEQQPQLLDGVGTVNTEPPKHQPSSFKPPPVQPSNSTFMGQTSTPSIQVPTSPASTFPTQPVTPPTPMLVKAEQAAQSADEFIRENQRSAIAMAAERAIHDKTTPQTPVNDAGLKTNNNPMQELDMCGSMGLYEIAETDSDLVAAVLLALKKGGGNTCPKFSIRQNRYP